MNFNDVCCILDLDGFTLSCAQSGTRRSEFLCRELGYIQVDENKDYEPLSYHFNLKSRLDALSSSMSPDSRKALEFQSKKIVGLTLLPGKNERDVIDAKKLDDVVKEIYEECKVLSHKTAIAFKGGSFEKDLLDRLKIPSLNLELFGCPTFKNLLSQFPSKYGQNCGRHNKIVTFHCPLAEVTAFRDWYKTSFNQFKGCCGIGSSSSSAARSWSHGSSSSDSDP